MSTSDVAWGVLGATSVVLLLVALISPEGIRLALVAIGLLGLMVFRLAVMSDGRISPRPATTERRSEETP